MGMILDSSIIIANERGRFDLPEFFKAHRQEAFFITAITASELLHGIERANTTARRLARTRFVEAALAQLPVIDFDLLIARQHALLWAKLEKLGKMIGAHDLQIAATALEGNHSLATLNTKEFRQVSGLTLEKVDPFLIA